MFVDPNINTVHKKISKKQCESQANPFPHQTLVLCLVKPRANQKHQNEAVEIVNCEREYLYYILYVGKLERDKAETKERQQRAKRVV